ncbi:GDSL-type esterase/lipase family protein [Candidatus Soleaferrea massiliensis]|uniref:GDSL-type esterase/lipase family protein n=1 Tax=Candidatus Soleaferrea massiliensis TaxID=1470354 RepID=UPI000694BC46|nr:GDSL-type esterase/lipase family protein [Candidatus Soleaferrea massiliensis]
MKYKKTYENIFHKKQWRKRLVFPLSVLGILAVVLLSSGVLFLVQGSQDGGNSPQQNHIGDKGGTSSGQITHAGSSSQAESSSVSSKPPEPSKSPSEAPSKAPESKPDGEKEGPHPKAEPVDDSYFDDTLFIGNSRTEGLKLYSGLTNATFYSSTGLTVAGALEKPVVETDAGCITIPEALKQRAFGEVYLMMGINELGWYYSDVFLEDYAELIDDIKAAQPDAVIYLQSILPVSREKSDSDEVINMKKIGEYNELIKQLARDKGVVYLNVGECMSDDDGYLIDDATTDGIHLNKEYCLKWVDYLKTHTKRKG